MLATMALAAVVFGGGVWWLWRGARRVRPLYRRWRWRDSVVVFGFREPGRAWLADAALAALLAWGGPLVPGEVDAARAWGRVLWIAAVLWFIAGAPPLGAWR